MESGFQPLFLAHLSCTEDCITVEACSACTLQTSTPLAVPMSCISALPRDNADASELQFLCCTNV